MIAESATPTSAFAPQPNAMLSIPSILESVQRRLRESSYYYLRSVSCAFEEGVLTLSGRVPTFYLKQTVQSLAEKVEGVRQVVNLVDVVNPAGVQ